jgi:hypothetical protein
MISDNIVASPLDPLWLAGLRGDLSTYRASALHTGFGWDLTNYPISPTVRLLNASAQRLGSAGITPEALFDRFSTARSAPGATFHVVAGNSDSNNGTSVGTAVGTINKAITLANATGLPSKIFVYPGLFPRSASPSLNGTVWPTVDIAIVNAGNGRVITGTFDQFAAPSLDATNTNTYAITIGGVDRVVDISRRDRFGNYPELTQVASAAICNITPNSWFSTGTVLYIRRHDSSAVLNTNTRVYRSGANQTIRLAGAQTNVYLEGLDCEGGSNVLGTVYTSKPATRKAIVGKDCSFNYAGYAAITTVNGVSVDALHGIAAFFNCSANANASDNFNFHNVAVAGCTVAWLLVNCSATDAGRSTSLSCNAITSHEDITGLDICGDYHVGRGGTARFINGSKTGMIGTRIRGDIGDMIVGGTTPPCAVQIDNAAQLWADMVDIDMPAGTWAWRALSGTTLYRRNCWARQPDQGAGTFLSF